MTEQIKKLRLARRAVDESLFAQQNRLRAKEAQLASARRLGEAGRQQAAVLEREIAALGAAVERERSQLRSLQGDLAGLVGELVLPQSPQQLASQLDDSLPCLLFPVRMETRFMSVPGGRELWVRVYPDDIAVHTHEAALTRDEAVAGIRYWTSRAVAATLEDAAERERLEMGAWRALANSFGGTRAAWIAAELRRRALAKEENEDLSFLLAPAEGAAILADPRLDATAKREALLALLTLSHPLIDALRDPISSLLLADEAIGDETRQAIARTIEDGMLTYLGFDLEALKPESWSRAPRTEVLPDRFVLIGETGGNRREFPFPAPVASPLILGPNPQALESELAQQGGDLVVGSDFAWIWDFEAAIAVGMAMRLPLPEPFASAGFDRLMVLGMRVSDEPAEHREMLEELIDNHRYAPEGMGFLAQGTPTNHTTGFSTDDAEGDASFELEAAPPAVVPATEDLDKRDAQRLAEAWDVSLDKLAGLRNAELEDVSRAKLMNQALWPATLGYFLAELLETDAAANDRVCRFFTADVVARGSLPAIRVGKQPYGVLVTSAFGRWRIDDRVDGEDAAFLRQVHDILARVEVQWQQLVGQVSRVDSPGDSFAHLLNILGLQATSVDFRRRIGTYKTMLWNLAHLFRGGNFGGGDPVVRYFQEVSRRGIQLLNDLGFRFPKLPKLFGLLFSDGTSGLDGPFIDDVASAADEKLSETAGLPLKYAVATGEGEAETRNYIGWLIASELDTLKQQKLVDLAGAALPPPAALLYRLLHRALLLAQHDATMKLYEELQLVGPNVRREEDFTNVEAGRTVTRWELMEARVNQVMPQVSGADLAIGDFLSTPAGLARPAAELLREVRESIAALEPRSTAELERLAAEHLDLCSYRLDAWQGALFSRRLARLNLLRQDPTGEGPGKRGVHLGAYGWLENVRPGPAPVPVSPAEIPAQLREDGVAVVEQPNNGGHIHGPSINHAVAAAVLRNAYLTHADQQNATHFSVKVTSERVRTAVSFLEGVRNGQELGALLGYQFERALHDRYVIEGTALAQFILAFRKKYPLVADKVTPDAADEPIDRKEAYQVVDGYALLQAVFLQQPPLQYPFGVEGLPPDPANGAARAIVAEVERLQDTLDAIADLSLAEGVFQVTQGNYERAGAMLKAISEGNAPPEPEIIRTPRGGSVVNHRVAIHLETGAVASPWSGPPTPRAVAAPGLNKWLGERIGGPQSLQFSVRYDLDGAAPPQAISIGELNLQPIDLIYLVGDEAGTVEGGRQINDLTELEVRIDHAYRLKRRAADPSFDPSGRTTIEFMSTAGFPAGDGRTFFELLPLLRNLRHLVTTCRPLGADDYVLPSEENTDPLSGGNIKRWDLQALKGTLDDAALSLRQALDSLQTLIGSLPADALNPDPEQAPDLGGVDYDGLRSALVRLSSFGLPGAFPKQALLPELPPAPTPAQRLALLRARQSLIEQAVLTHQQGAGRHAQAESLSTFSALSQEERDRLTVEEKAGTFQRAAALILGDAFRLIPTFTFRNQPELEAARAFASAATPAESLLRFTHARLASSSAGSAIEDWRGLAVDEWLQGAAAVRGKLRLVDQLQTYQEAFAGPLLAWQPLQLPFDRNAHWIAVEFPPVSPEQLDDTGVFVPRGDFLSMVRHLPAGHSAAAVQAGLLVDEWNEVIPNRVETTGIAVHYNQPNTEPPQCLLLAVSPTIKGRWEWDDLVATLVDTFERAKRRAVEPDFLRATPYAQLLPAVLSTFTSYPFATISTNLAAQEASLVFEGGG
ncbi:MAG TPA: hypothetical protein VFS60_12900 [Thermoanaerobaculia bacterium]|nr:hypothetical protein [Thermoanaerobaculia bacterium]